MSGKPSRKGNRTVNDTIKAVHDLLVDQIDNLSAEMDTNTDPVVSKKLLTEMDEMTHRLEYVYRNLMSSCNFEDAQLPLCSPNQSGASIRSR